MRPEAVEGLAGAINNESGYVHTCGSLGRVKLTNVKRKERQKSKGDGSKHICLLHVCGARVKSLKDIYQPGGLRQRLAFNILIRWTVCCIYYGCADLILISGDY